MKLSTSLLVRSRASAPPRAGSRAVPYGMRDVAAALSSGSDPRPAACDSAGAYARAGKTLDVLLADLEHCFEVLMVMPPDPAMVRTVSIAWADRLEGRFDHVACVDTATGLATVHHLQAYVRQHHATHAAAPGRLRLIVADDVRDDTDESTIAWLADPLRRAFPDAVMHVALTPRRCAALVHGTVAADRRAALLRVRYDDVRAGAARVWVEHVPDDPDASTAALAELAR